MPEISRFYGIIIRMFYNDHSPPHFHAIYGDYEAVFDINSLEIIAGNIPNRAKMLIIEWTLQNRDKLVKNWEKAGKPESLDKINPLD